MHKLFVAAAMTVLLAGGVGAHAQKGLFTDDLVNVHYVVGQSICRIVDQNAKMHDLHCVAPSTGEAIDPIDAIRNISQLDPTQPNWQHNAYGHMTQEIDSQYIEPLSPILPQDRHDLDKIECAACHEVSIDRS